MCKSPSPNKEKAKSTQTPPKWPIFRTRRDTARYLKACDFTKKADYIEYLLDELAEYATKDDTTSLTKFIRKMKLPRSTFYDMLEAHQELHKEWNEAKLDIAENRRELGSWKKLDKDLALRWLHVLDPDEDKVNQYHAELKKQNEATATGDKYIIIKEAKSYEDPKKKETTDVLEESRLKR